MDTEEFIRIVNEGPSESKVPIVKMDDKSYLVESLTVEEFNSKKLISTCELCCIDPGECPLDPIFSSKCMDLIGEYSYLTEPEE